jgi:hypothetical protein
METNENAHNNPTKKLTSNIGSGPDGMLLIEDGYKTSTNHEASDGVVHHNEIQLNFGNEPVKVGQN